MQEVTERPAAQSRTTQSRAPSSAEEKPRSFVLTEKLIAATRPESVQAESFRALRSSILSQHMQSGRRALAICAPARETGCTFVAANLAYVMAQAGVNTLLVDGNLREPALGDYIAPSDSPAGLADCLRDDAFPLSSAVVRVNPSLAVLYAGQAGEDVYDRLGSVVFRSLTSHWLRDFDLTIIDTPAANLYADARRIATTLRYALIVTCRNRTFVKDVRTLVDELKADGALPIGTFQNDY